VRDDHSDLGGTDVCHRQRRFDRAGQAVAIVAHRQQAQSVAAAAGPQELAQHRRIALTRGSLGFEDEGRGTFA